MIFFSSEVWSVHIRIKHIFAALIAKNKEMKAVKIIVIVLVVILAIVLIPPIFMKGDVKIERSLVMKAQPEVIFEQVNCLQNWKSWNPWGEYAVNERFEGPECGVGAKSMWDDEGSTSSQTITESAEYEYIKTELLFMGTETVWTSFKFEPLTEGTKVTWDFKADARYPIGRWISTLFIVPEVGKSYEKGLATLNDFTKDMVPMPKYKTGDVTVTEVTSQMAVGIKVESGIQDMGFIMGQTYGKLMDFIGAKGAQMAGTPFAIYYQWEDTSRFVYECAVPVVYKVKGEGDIRFINTYQGKAASVEHWGDYSTTGNSWEKLMKYVSNNNLEKNGDPWEVYITDPGSEPNPEKWLTVLYFPVK
jgi:effector-binding domain-containing protein